MNPQIKNSPPLPNWKNNHFKNNRLIYKNLGTNKSNKTYTNPNKGLSLPTQFLQKNYSKRK